MGSTVLTPIKLKHFTWYQFRVKGGVFLLFSFVSIVQKKNFLTKKATNERWAFSVGAIETLFDVQNQPLRMKKIRNKVMHFQLHNTQAKWEVLTVRLTSAWSGILGSGKNPQVVVIELDAAIEMAVQTKKSKAYILYKIQKEHQQAIEEHEQAVVLLKDNLRICDKQIQAIKYENVGSQSETHAKDKQIGKCENTINHLRELCVTREKIPDLDNLGMIVCKYTSKDNDKHFDYPYYIVHIQRHAITAKRIGYKKIFKNQKDLGELSTLAAYMHLIVLKKIM